MTDLELALRYMPILHFDALEPVALHTTAYTVFHTGAPSVSFPGRKIPALEGGCTIEYAFFYLYDIDHMYDLEHAWIMLDAQGEIRDAQGSFHGKYLNLLVPEMAGYLPPENGHVHVIVQPRKHAMQATPCMTMLCPGWKQCCEEAGGPVLIGNPFSARFSPTGKDLFVPTAQDDANSIRFLHEELSFVPSMDFSHTVKPQEVMTWQELYDLIPGWIAQECARLRERYGEV